MDHRLVIGYALINNEGTPTTLPAVCLTAYGSGQGGIQTVPLLCPIGNTKSTHCFLLITMEANTMGNQSKLIHPPKSGSVNPTNDPSRCTCVHDRHSGWGERGQGHSLQFSGSGLSAICFLRQVQAAGSAAKSVVQRCYGILMMCVLVSMSRAN